MDQPISLETVIGFLVATPLFGGLDAAERGEIARIMKVRRLTAGEEVFHEADVGDAWYVIYAGRAEVVKQLPSGPVSIATLERGACFGEMAILDGSARSASVRAVDSLTVFRFQRVLFEELLEQGSLAAYKLVAAMARVLSERHRRLTHQLSELMHRDPMVDRYQVSE